ncbi:MAG: cohesin domain-containing protein [Anaerolineae bacterium]
MRKTHRGTWLALGLVGAAVVAVLVGWLAATNSAQADANHVLIDPASATVEPAGTVDVDVVADAPAAKLGSWDLRVTYDATVVDATGCAGQSNCNLDFAPDTVALNGFNAGGLSGEQVLATITFTAIGDAGDSSAVSISVVAFRDPDDQETTPKVTDGTITIAAPATPTATPTPTETPVVLPPTGGTPPDSSGPAGWLLAGIIALGLAVMASGAWATRRLLRQSR